MVIIWGNQSVHNLSGCRSREDIFDQLQPIGICLEELLNKTLYPFLSYFILFGYKTL